MTEKKAENDRHFVMSSAHVYNKCPFSVREVETS